MEDLHHGTIWIIMTISDIVVEAEAAGTVVLHNMDAWTNLIGRKNLD